jgi:hypothetical protein
LKAFLGRAFVCCCHSDAPDWPFAFSIDLGQQYSDEPIEIRGMSQRRSLDWVQIAGYATLISTALLLIIVWVPL